MQQMGIAPGQPVVPGQVVVCINISLFSQKLIIAIKLNQNCHKKMTNELKLLNNNNTYQIYTVIFI